MRIESVTAHAFGPFKDEPLALAPGMTVIFGPNESGQVELARGYLRRALRHAAGPWQSKGQ